MMRLAAFGSLALRRFAEDMLIVFIDESKN